MPISHDSIQQVLPDYGRPAVFIPDLIVSGGQTGADYGALLGAKALGIPTVGHAPKGFKTERGPRPDLGSVFGLIELDSEDYNLRTEWNVSISKAVIIVARNFKSPGTVLTRKLAHTYWIPAFEVPCPVLPKLESEFLIKDLRGWLDWHRPDVLMIAGNRESVAVGVEAWTRALVLKLFS